MADNEIIADIIADKRFDATTRDQFDSAYIVDFCDRLEAAHKREAVTVSNQFGDAAKLREALKLCVDEMCDRCRELAVARGNPLPCLSGCEPVRKAKAALAAPATAEKSSAVGDAAKLREALDELVANIEMRGSTFGLNVIVDTKTYLDAKAALAAPPRNCDRYATVDEAMEYFADEALIEEWNALRAGKDRDMLAVELFVFTKWLFAPATVTEGDDDENE